MRDKKTAKTSFEEFLLSLPVVDAEHKRRRRTERDRYQTTPEALRELRRVSGLTQSESATACLATLEEWRDWESGRAPMHPAIYRALIEAISGRKKAPRG